MLDIFSQENITGGLLFRILPKRLNIVQLHLKNNLSRKKEMAKVTFWAQLELPFSIKESVFYGWYIWILPCGFESRVPKDSNIVDVL